MWIVGCIACLALVGVGCADLILTAEETARVKQFASDIAALEIELAAVIAQGKILVESGTADPVMIADLAGRAATIAAKIAGIKGQIEQIIADAEKRSGGGTWNTILTILQQALIAALTYLGVRQGRLAFFAPKVEAKPIT